MKLGKKLNLVNFYITGFYRIEDMLDSSVCRSEVLGKRMWSYTVV